MAKVARAFALALASSAAPAAVVAQEASGRALSTGADTRVVAIVTVLAVLAVFFVASLGYLYRRERQLDWEFQQPDAPRGDDHH
jgi:uncharacterized ion transporter superfamily protein YfcC